MAELEEEDTRSDLAELTILEVASSPISYIIPSFPVFTVQLRQMKWQYIEASGDVYVCDGFVRHCPALDGTVPLTVLVEKGYSCMFFIEVCFNTDSRLVGTMNMIVRL